VRLLLDGVGGVLYLDGDGQMIFTNDESKVLYLDGDGQMIFTNDESKAETSIDITPGRFIAWHNSASKHRVVHGPRNVMGWDDASQEETREGKFGQAYGGLLSVCGGTQTDECTDLAGYRCDGSTYVSIAEGNSSIFDCANACDVDVGQVVGYYQFDSINSVCYCGYSTACSTFTPSPGFVQFKYNGGTCPTLAEAPTGAPSLAPVSTSAPSNAPATSSPSSAPTSTSAPSNSPVTSSPSEAPTSTAAPSGCARDVVSFRGSYCFHRRPFQCPGYSLS